MENELLTQTLSEVKAIREQLNQIVQPEFLSLKEAAKFLMISESTMQKFSANRLLPFFKPNKGKVYFLKKDLEEYIRSGRRKSIFESN